jgi:hypothetical protein
MFRADDSFVFQRVTGGLRKPIMRFRLASGRNIELIALHFEPGWAFNGEHPRPIIKEVIARLYPNEEPLIIADVEKYSGAAFLCVAYFYSDTPVKERGCGLDYSVLLVCALVENLNQSVRNTVCDILAKVDWESHATNDSMW